MNADLLKRLFRAVHSGSEPSLRKVVDSIIADERKKGHEGLAKQLEDILNAPKPLLRQVKRSKRHQLVSELRFRGEA